MTLDWSPFVELVRPRQRFVLTTHVRPDPDGLGSMLALADVLRSLGKQVEMFISSVWPPRYTFMDPRREIRRFAEADQRELQQAELIVVLDTGTWNQLGDFGTGMKSVSCAKAVIDHHLSQDDLGASRFVDTSAEATGRLVHEAALALGAPLSSEAADHLFAAVATDTGWFRHSNTTPATFALVEALQRAGANPTHLYDQIYEQNTLPRLRLMGVALERMTVTAGGRVAYIEVRREDYDATGATPSDTEDLINFTRSIAGVEVGLFFMEQPAGGVKVSFRSRSKVDVAKIAEQFNGGGHRLASGAILQVPLAEAREEVLHAVGQALV
jgi:phosphoesterase RecJ-like protein